MKRVLTVLLFLVLGSYLAAQTPVTFNVDMSIQAKKGKFDVATGTMKLAGTLTNWGTGAVAMSKSAENDSIFTVTLDKKYDDTNIEVGDTLNFKFIKGSDSWENLDNRTYIVTSGTNVFTAYFENDSVYNPTAEVQLLFTCNMELEIASGRFDPAQDTLRVKGTLNGWSNTSIMTAGLGGSYTFDTTQAYAVGDKIEYKFNYTKTGEGEKWEGGDNRVHEVTADDTTNGFIIFDRGFNDLSLEDVVNQEASILFTVDVSNAIDVHTNQPITDVQNVILAGAVTPLQWPESGWPSATAADSARVIFMNDSGVEGDKVAGDKIWSKLIDFPKYTGLTVQYKYGINFGIVDINDNENSTMHDHFFDMTTDLTYGETVDTFGIMGTKELANVEKIGVEEVPGLDMPKTFSLNQNYPNPFNPSTVIRYAIPQNAFVTLKVYNLLGQEIATLVNAQQNANNYEVTFDASKLSSGIYFYAIKAGSYVNTKKMMLIK